MEMETKIVELEIDDTLDDKMKKLTAEGWGLVPNVKPIGKYFMCRLKPGMGGGGHTTGAVGRLLIDDAGVMIIPADKLKN